MANCRYIYISIDNGIYKPTYSWGGLLAFYATLWWSVVIHLDSCSSARITHIYKLCFHMFPMIAHSSHQFMMWASWAASYSPTSQGLDQTRVRTTWVRPCSSKKRLLVSTLWTSMSHIYPYVSLKYAVVTDVWMTNWQTLFIFYIYIHIYIYIHMPIHNSVRV